MKKSLSIYFCMGGLFYESKSNFKIFVSGICAVRRLPAFSCTVGFQTGYWQRPGYSRNLGHLCTGMSDWRLFCRENVAKGQIQMGIRGGILLFCIACSGIFCCSEKMGYEHPASGYNVFYVSGRRNFGRDALMIKKCF